MQYVLIVVLVVLSLVTSYLSQKRFGENDMYYGLSYWAMTVGFSLLTINLIFNAVLSWFN